mgnify:FL=1
MNALDRLHVRSLVRAALREDVGSGDITTLLTVPEGRSAAGRFVARQDGVIAGLDVARAVFASIDSGIGFDIIRGDGSRVGPGDAVAVVSGPARGILTGERVALNFLQRMSGIATLTARYVERVAHTDARIADTRKTTPGLRRLEKYAVTVGGGVNHRFGLSDGILIKDNHISAAGSVTEAVTAAKRRAPHTLKIEVEVTDLDELDEAIAAGADAVLLDNMEIETIRRAVEAAAGRVILEASGGVNVDTVAAIAETGVDIISVGALTHSAHALDISLEFGPG